MRQMFVWWLVHAVHWALLILAFGHDVSGALYTIKFWVWAMLPISILMLADDAIKSGAKKPKRPILRTLSWLQGCATLGALVWFGHIFSGVAWAIVMFACAGAIQRTDSVRQAMAGAATK